MDIGDHNWPDLSAEEVDEAIRWWVAKLNGLLGTALDPSVFAGSDGVYSPSLHLSTHLSLDRLASTITAILAYELTGQAVRKVMFFDAMDLFEGMGWDDYKKTLSHPVRRPSWKDSNKRCLRRSTRSCLAAVDEQSTL